MYKSQSLCKRPNDEIKGLQHTTSLYYLRVIMIFMYMPTYNHEVALVNLSIMLS